jgi:hypothetical protein
MGSHVKADHENFFAVLPMIGMEGMEGMGQFVGGAFLSAWRQIVRKYSTTNLSRDSDLLKALAGLTEPLRTNYQLTWSFGLCRDVLLREMLWYVRGGEGLPFRDRAPTWSWASIDVRGPQIVHEASLFTTLVATLTAMPDETKFTRERGFSTEESEFRVRLLGPLRFGIPSISISRQSGASSSSSLSRRNEFRMHPHCPAWVHTQCPFHPDYEHLEEDIDLYSLLVARCSNNNPEGQDASQQQWDTEIGLVLTPFAGHPRRYRRVGYFHHNMQHQKDATDHPPLPSFFGDEYCEVQEVEII